MSEFTTTRRRYAEQQLRALGVRMNPSHIGARRFLCAWMHGETGENPGLCDGVPGHGARWNPMNTTLAMPHSTLYNHLSADSGVRNYATSTDGATAFASTLLHSPGHGYEALVAALRKPFVTQRECADALAASDWGTREPLVTAMLSGYNSNRSKFNRYPIGA